MTDMNLFAAVDLDDMVEPYLGVIEHGLKRSFRIMRKVNCWEGRGEGVVFVWGKQGLYEFPNIYSFMIEDLPPILSGPGHIPKRHIPGHIPGNILDHLPGHIPGLHDEK